MFWFATASLLPPAMIWGATLWGGGWSWAALFSITLWVLLLDRLARERAPEQAGPAATVLQVTLALAHFALLLPVATAAARIGWENAIPLVLAHGLFMGQISHPNAHELIHRPNRQLRRLGVLIYSSMLIGHHASAHLKVHHVHVATPQDPNTARRGEGFYRFLIRAWTGSFRAGFRAEQAARARRMKSGLDAGHPYITYVAVGICVPAIVFWTGGPAALAAFLCAAAHAQIQIFIADYVQHYGLLRVRHGNGRLVPVGPAHSWNAPQWYSSSMMLNAPRHSDHHMSPGRPFPELRLTDGMPVLPHSLPVMGAIALIPPLWRRMMERQLNSLEVGPS